MCHFEQHDMDENITLVMHDFLELVSWLNVRKSSTLTVVDIGYYVSCSKHVVTSL